MCMLVRLVSSSSVAARVAIKPCWIPAIIKWLFCQALPPRTDKFPSNKTYYEIPIAIQDRAFNTDGSLFYPDTREFFDGFAGPYLPDTDISPIWNPEFFGNM